MIGSGAIDVAIGLVFTYFLFSMLCSGIAELISRWLSRRGKLLKDAITGLLQSKADDFWAHPLVQPLGTPHGPTLKPGAPSGVQGAAPSSTALPSYISASTFARTVIAFLESPSAEAGVGTMAATLGTIRLLPDSSKLSPPSTVRRWATSESSGKVSSSGSTTGWTA
jgi:hypothetical protein